MADLPILFSAPMVRGLIREVERPGTGKRQTRRIVNFPGVDKVIEFVRVGTDKWTGVPVFEMKDVAGQHLTRPAGKHSVSPQYAPRFGVGDRLYVREHWRTESKAYDDLKPSEMDADYSVIFEADGDWKANKTVGRFRQGMHMPRRASRLTLAVTDVRVQRLQSCSEADALAEGIEQHGRFYGLRDADWDDAELSAVAAHRRVWGQINGAGSWDRNPWIVALTFTVEKRNIDALPMAYLIWSNVHNAWWGANRAGYFTELSSAGRYTREEAIAQCANGRDGFTAHRRPPELPVREIDAINRGGRTIDDLVLRADRSECRTRDLSRKAKVSA